MHTPPTFLGRATTLFVVSSFALAGCGRSDLLPLGDDEPEEAGPDGFSSDGGFPDVAPPFDTSFEGMPEDVSPDRGPPPTCGDHVCDDGETCFSCPEDCGLCPSCGNGVCNDGETCLSCAPDCGPCPDCGDGTCTPPDETCFTCPEDCGACPGCGNGICEADETCGSCEEDCGPCAVCGNGKCDPFETCSNCPADCGACVTTTCLELVTCALRCSNPLMPACISDCLSGACPDALSDFTNVFTCAAQNVGACGGQFNLACVEQQCPGEVTACLNATCADAGE